MKLAPGAETQAVKDRSTTSFPLRIGSIDIGSNAMRAMVAEFASPGSYTVLVQDRRAIRLGHDVFLTGRLTQEAMDAAVEALRAFAKIFEEHQVVRYRAVTTSAVRDARNGEEFLERAERESG